MSERSITIRAGLSYGKIDMAMRKISEGLELYKATNGTDLDMLASEGLNPAAEMLMDYINGTKSAWRLSRLINNVVDNVTEIAEVLVNDHLDNHLGSAGTSESVHSISESYSKLYLSASMRFRDMGIADPLEEIEAAAAGITTKAFFTGMLAEHLLMAHIQDCDTQQYFDLNIKPQIEDLKDAAKSYLEAKEQLKEVLERKTSKSKLKAMRISLECSVGLRALSQSALDMAGNALGKYSKDDKEFFKNLLKSREELDMLEADGYMGYAKGIVAKEVRTGYGISAFAGSMAGLAGFLAYESLAINSTGTTALMASMGAAETAILAFSIMRTRWFKKLLRRKDPTMAEEPDQHIEL